MRRARPPQKGKLRAADHWRHFRPCLVRWPDCEKEREGVSNNLVQTGYHTTKPNQIGTQKPQNGEKHNPDREKTTAGSLLTRHRPARPHMTHRPPRPPPPAPPGPRTQPKTEEPAPRPRPGEPRPRPERATLQNVDWKK